MKHALIGLIFAVAGCNSSAQAQSEPDQIPSLRASFTISGGIESSGKLRSLPTFSAPLVGGTPAGATSCAALAAEGNRDNAIETGFSSGVLSPHGLLVGISLTDYPGPGSYELDLDGVYADSEFLDTPEKAVFVIDSAANG